MSYKTVTSVCFVVDASIARAAGSLESTHPTGTRCRQFLRTLRGVCHRMAWNAAIKAEWDKHQSAFASTWRVSMFNLGKLRTIPDEQSEAFRDAIHAHSTDEGVVAVMLKDAHLVEAAFAADGRVAALDDTVRGHFARLAGTFEDLRAILWANPAAEGDECIGWLEGGAEHVAARCLSAAT